MKRVVFLFLIILGFLSQGKSAPCDTIDFYWIYYNDTVWVKLNQNMYGYQLKIDKINIKRNDSISIKYGTDTPGEDRWNSIQLEDDKHTLLKENIGKGDWSRISFSVNELIKIATICQIKTLYFYYNNDNRRLLFQLKLE